MMRRIAVVSAFLFLAAVAHAEDVWVLEGNAATNLPRCEVVLWRPGVVAHNRGSEAVTIRPLHVSNGGAPAPATVVPAGTSAVVTGGTADAPAWITRLDVPAGAGLEARMELYSGSCNPVGVPPPIVPFTKIRMPVTRRLAPAGEEQIHYGTDLGGTNTRQNVGVFNAGTVAANVTIRVVQPFCGRTHMQTAVVPADTFLQITLSPIELCAQNAPQTSAAYTIVTVDQQSLTIVSTLRNDAAPAVTASVSQ